MAVILLRLAAPLQSWGVNSKYDYRKTEKEPSKSGVIGLIAAALGRGRTESVEDLSKMKFGVRTDLEGKIMVDYQTARSDKSAYIIRREYLEDAVFLVGLETDDADFLEEIAYALEHPVHNLFLGRRSCPPTLPLFIGIREGSLKNVLKEEPLQLSEWRIKKYLDSGGGLLKLRLTIESDDQQEGWNVEDVPVSFDVRKREYTFRNVYEEFFLFSIGEESAESVAEHDPMAEL